MLEELHRFANGPTTVLGRMYWDVLAQWSEVKHGMARYASRLRRHRWQASASTRGALTLACFDAADAAARQPGALSRCAHQWHGRARSLRASSPPKIFADDRICSLCS
jgi:hypothetical protein